MIARNCALRSLNRLCGEATAAEYQQTKQKHGSRGFHARHAA
jgi:hypothetical protein